MPLYRYQLRWAETVYQLGRRPDDQVIVVEMPRQSGKNEASSHIEVGLLASYSRRGGEIVKAAPTFQPQIINSKQRFEQRARQAASRWGEFKPKGYEGYQYRIGRAGISFFSAAPGASVVGATASILMVLDEAQDVGEAKFNKDFSPMRASTGSGIVAYGTTWTDDTLLEKFKQDVLEGRKRGKIYKVLPDEVGAENPAYLRFVQSEVDRLGRSHPLIRTQYFLEALENRGRLLSTQQLRSMVGDHSRRYKRTNERIVVAGLDFAGADEQAGDLVSLANMSKRDSVALTVGEVEWIKNPVGRHDPMIRILARYEWTNIHPADLHQQIYRILQDGWRIQCVRCDSTGVGEVSTRLLSRDMDGSTETRVQGVKFDSAWTTHTRLATQYIAQVNAARLRDYQPGFDVIAVAHADAPDKDDVDKHTWWQRGHARLEAKTSERYRAYVPDAEGHDDLLISDMLMVDAAYSIPPAPPLAAQTRRQGFDT